MTMEPPMSLLHSLRGLPQIRERLHTICALYAHARPDRKVELLDHLERMTLEAASAMATELLEVGWRPDSLEPV
jgi:hypothetical protein